MNQDNLSQRFNFNIRDMALGFALIDDEQKMSVLKNLDRLNSEVYRSMKSNEDDFTKIIDHAINSGNAQMQETGFELVKELIYADVITDEETITRYIRAAQDTETKDSLLFNGLAGNKLHDQGFVTETLDGFYDDIMKKYDSDMDYAWAIMTATQAVKQGLLSDTESVANWIDLGKKSDNTCENLYRSIILADAAVEQDILGKGHLELLTQAIRKGMDDEGGEAPFHSIDLVNTLMDKGIVDDPDKVFGPELVQKIREEAKSMVSDSVDKLEKLIASQYNNI